MPSRQPEPAWLSRLVIDAIHLDQIREHGGLLGLRDETGLESALARPRHQWLYEPDADIAALAAAYGFGLSRNHPYNDGNKRVALVAMLAFLTINGHDLDANGDDVLATMLALAAGRLSEATLAEWIRARLSVASRQAAYGPPDESGASSE
jgi:death-on-curing protein